MSGWGARTIRAFAIANAAFVAGGLYFLAEALWRHQELGPLAIQGPYYPQVFYIRSVLNFGFIVALAVGNFGLWRMTRRGRRICNAVFVGELAYVVGGAVLDALVGHHGGTAAYIGQAIADTAGTGNMGITLQIITFYPVIALVALNLAYWRLGRQAGK